MRRILSVVLPAFLLLGIVASGVRRIFLTDELWNSFLINPDIIVVLILVLWLLYELQVSIRDKEKELRISDYGTREFYGFSQSTTVLSAFFFCRQLSLEFGLKKRCFSLWRVIQNMQQTKTA